MLRRKQTFVSRILMVERRTGFRRMAPPSETTSEEPVDPTLPPQDSPIVEEKGE